MVKRELVDLRSLSSWCLVVFLWLFLAVTRVCLQFVIVVIPDHTHYFLEMQCLNQYLREVKMSMNSFQFKAA